MGLENFAKAIENLQSLDFREVVRQTVVENQAVIVELQKEQLSEGLDINGQSRVDSYSSQYAALKKKKYEGLGAVTDIVTFYATGDLYRSLKLKIRDFNYEVVSDDSNFEWMTERITNEKYGLSPDSRDSFTISYIMPNIETSFYGAIRY